MLWVKTETKRKRRGYQEKEMRIKFLFSLKREEKTRYLSEKREVFIMKYMMMKKRDNDYVSDIFLQDVSSYVCCSDLL